ncbi:MAG TPA: c-type cytochrome [Solirubrobacteraceae bacterium]|jgi:quinol---cytochrome-c reductase cytochrome c subunit|nr:c-type cytochrome [Solirubrobacteraceae bacterium]
MRRVAPIAGACALFALSAILGAAPAAAQPPSGIVRPTTEPPKPTLELGAQLFAGNCASCHGIAGSGITKPRPGAGNLTGEGPPLRGVGALAPDFYLRSGYMPLGNPYEQPEANRVLLTDKEIRSLVSYVASLGAGPGIPHPKPSHGDISEGQELFTSTCAGCHQLEGRGGFVTGARVPPLQNLPAKRIAEAVRIGPYLMPKFSKSQISDSQLNSIIRYVQSTNAPDNRGGWSIGNLGPIPEGLVVWWIAIPLILFFCLLVARRRRSQ